MLPALLLVLAMVIYPLYFALSYSVAETAFWDRIAFVGPENYLRLFRDTRFLNNLGVSAVFVFGGVAISTTIGTLLALVLRRGFRAQGLIRTLIFIPWITSEVVSAIVWRWLLNTQYGPGPYVFGAVGLPFGNAIGTPTAALATVTLVNVWRSVAFPMVMALAALQTISREVEDAAAVDGAGTWQKTWHITLPHIRPVLLVTIIVLTISYFNIITLILVLTGGGPLAGSEVLGLRLYKEGFEYFNIGTASAIAVVMLCINVVMAFGYFRALQTQAGDGRG